MHSNSLVGHYIITTNACQKQPNYWNYILQFLLCQTNYNAVVVYYFSFLFHLNRLKRTYLLLHNMLYYTTF